MKDKKGVTIVNGFQSILNDFKRKPNRTRVDISSEFYNRSIKSWLQDNNINLYSSHNEGKSAVAERVVKTLKTKIYKCMASIPKNVYIDKAHDMNVTIHITEPLE